MTNKQLLEIISCALKDKKYDKEVINEKEVLVQADINGLLPLLFAGIEKNCFKEDNYKKLQKRFFANVYNDNEQQKIIKEIKNIFSEHQLEHIFLKGTHLKEIYQEPFYRPMGDIDVLIKEDKFELSRSIIKEAGFNIHSRSAEHDVYLYDDYLVEVHRHISKVDDNKKENFLSRPWDFAIKKSNYEYKFDYAFEGVYLLYHLKNHILGSGIGLRSVLDISIFFNYYEKEIDKSLLQKLLKDINLEVFFQTMLFINKKAFSLDSSFLNKEFKLNKEDYKQILDYITQSGIHGKGGNLNLMAPRVAKKGKFKTVFRLFFPSWKYMKENYRWLKYLPFLLPIAYILRGLEFLFLKTKYTFQKLRNVGKSDKEAEYLENIFKKMGL